MAYIGKSPDGTGVRARYYFTATGGETSLSGADDNAVTLSFADGAYVDVYLNGVLLVAGTDYNTTTTNTISGLASLAANDIVEILVYDIFTVADTVSASAGGTFSNSVTIDKDGGTALTVDRATSGGTIIDVQKDGSSVGTIAEKDGEITIGSGDVGLRFYAAGDAVIPVTSTNQEVRDNAIDLGGSSFRFNDAYLGGNLYIGGTGSANALSDYEEGTWTPQISATDGIGTLAYGAQVGRYTKIGNRVTFNMYLLVSTKGTVAGSIRFTLPFASANVANGYTPVSMWLNNTVDNTGWEGNNSHLTAFIAPNAQIIQPYALTNGNVGGLGSGDIKNGTDFAFSGVYEV